METVLDTLKQTEKRLYEIAQKGVATSSVREALDSLHKAIAALEGHAEQADRSSQES
jgi:uncharacterized protein (DUF2342 family)